MTRSSQPPQSILAIDTATDVLSVTLWIRSGRHSGQWTERCDAGLRHTERLMAIVARLLSGAGITPHDLSLVACMRGPGSFTGLRIGMASAKGLAAAIRRPDQPLPVVSVPTLECIASGLHAANRIPAAIALPVIDGRKHRYYGACLRVDSGGVGRLTDDLDLCASDMVAAARSAVAAAASSWRSLPFVVTGPHADGFLAELTDQTRAGIVLDLRARAGWSAELSRLAALRAERGEYDREDAGPDYVRSSDAELSIQTRSNPLGA